MDGPLGQNIAEASPPPPPPEVKVRTMRSDLESMAKSGGGGLPHFQSVKVVGLSGGKAGTPSATAKNKLMITLIAIVAVAALCVVVYFAYTLFFAH